MLLITDTLVKQLKKKYKINNNYNLKSETDTEVLCCLIDKLYNEGFFEQNKIDTLFVFGGTNDFGHGDAPFGSIDSDDIYTFCGAVNSLIKRLVIDFPSKKIIFMFS